IVLEHALESLHLGAGADPSRAQRLLDFGELRLADQRAAKDEKVFMHVTNLAIFGRPQGPKTPTDAVLSKLAHVDDDDVWLGADARGLVTGEYLHDGLVHTALLRQQ